MLSVIRNVVTYVLSLLLVILFIVFIQDKSNKLQDDNDEIVINLKNLHIPKIKSSSLPVPDFASFENTVEKKKAFFAYLLPEIKRQNNIVKKEREMVLSLKSIYQENQRFSTDEMEVFEVLKKKYKLNIVKDVSIEDTISQLIIRVDVIPEALILVQAANESGWGTSRFAQQGYNFFGLWCFKKGCGFVPRQRNDDAEHEVAKFKDLSHSVMTYIRNLNRLYAYQKLRQVRFNLKQQNSPVTAEALAIGLMSYSSRGQEYIDELLAMLRVNKKYMSVEI